MQACCVLAGAIIAPCHYLGACKLTRDSFPLWESHLLPVNPSHESFPSRSYCGLHWLESLCAALHSGAATLKMLLLLPKAMGKVITACAWLALQSPFKSWCNSFKESPHL